MSAPVRCRICDGATEEVGLVPGRLDERRYALRRCPSCAFAFIAEPRLDFEAIYDDAYYRGEGADPLIDYHEEQSNPRSIRRYEWRGILSWVSAVAGVGPDTAWLDYGCGAGGLLSYLLGHGVAHAFGYDQGPVVAELRRRGLPVLDEGELKDRRGTFDVVSAIEVIEHVIDPVAALSAIGELLRPGGHLFLTTTNSAPYRDRLATWRYVTPEIHVSFFEPRTLALALERAGFEVLFPGHAKGWRDIIRFKMLKNIGRRSSHPLEALVPWGVATRIVDARLGLSSQPVGRVRQGGEAPAT